MEDPTEVRLDDDAPVVVRHARNQPVARHTCVVDQDVEIACRVDEGFGLLRVGDIRFDRTSSRVARDCFRFVLARAVAERDVRAGTCELESDRTPDAPRPARDEGGLPFERRERLSGSTVHARECRASEKQAWKGRREGA